MIGTSLGPALLAAARAALTEANAAPEWADELQPSVVAILCAATALEAATNWAADAEPGWMDQPLPAPSRGTRDTLSPDRKWAAWVEHRGGTAVVAACHGGTRVGAICRDGWNSFGDGLGRLLSSPGRRPLDLRPLSRTMPA